MTAIRGGGVLQILSAIITWYRYCSKEMIARISNPKAAFIKKRISDMHTGLAAEKGTTGMLRLEYRRGGRCERQRKTV